MRNFSTGYETLDNAVPASSKSNGDIFLSHIIVNSLISQNESESRTVKNDNLSTCCFCWHERAITLNVFTF